MRDFTHWINIMSVTSNQYCTSHPLHALLILSGPPYLKYVRTHGARLYALPVHATRVGPIVCQPRILVAAKSGSR